MSDEQPTRSVRANRLMWALLRDLSKQVNWHGQHLSDDDWKTMCTAALKRQRVCIGIEGGFVVLGEPTRNMTIAQMNELIEFIFAFGAMQGVKFSASPEMAETA